MTLKQIGCVIVLLISIVLAVLSLAVTIPEAILFVAAFILIAALAGVSLI